MNSWDRKEVKETEVERELVIKIIILCQFIFFYLRALWVFFLLL